MRTFLAILILCIPTIANAGEPFFLKDGQRVVFLGDSNTYAGKFIAYLDAYLCTRFPEKRIELINLGLPSETVTGLSEPDHPYPRPNIHDRVDRALELAKPDVVVICYGMNDGIYYPFSEERFKKYQDGIRKLIAKVEKTGAKAVLMSPAPFDATSLKTKVLPKGAEKYSWLRPYERYDEEVLTKYSDWLLTLRDQNYVVIDAHAALLQHLATMRKGDPAYRISGDGIHPNANGHLVVALETLKQWKAPSVVRDLSIDVNKELMRAANDPPTSPDVTITSVRKNTVSLKSNIPLPMPADPAWSERAKEIEKFNVMVNRSMLKVENLRGFLAIRVGNPKEKGRRVSIQADQLAKGIDLLDLLKLDHSAKSAEVWKLIDEKNRMMGLAWLTHVGHKRPDTPKGIAFAEASKKAAVLNDRIREMCRPVEINLSIGPFGK